MLAYRWDRTLLTQASTARVLVRRLHANGVYSLHDGWAHGHVMRY